MCVCVCCHFRLAMPFVIIASCGFFFPSDSTSSTVRVICLHRGVRLAPVYPYVFDEEGTLKHIKDNAVALRVTLNFYIYSIHRTATMLSLALYAQATYSGNTNLIWAELPVLSLCPVLLVYTIGKLRSIAWHLKLSSSGTLGRLQT